ncbi:MAG TPA: YbhN family protein [Acidimicrobiales bacterium]
MATTVRVPRSVRRIVAVLVVAAIVEFFVLPQLATARGSAETLRDVSAWLLGFGVALEAAALVAYFQLTRSLLPGATRPSFLRMARIELSTLALSHVVPGGPGPAGALGYRLLTEAGVRPADATFALATQGLGSAVVLNVIFWLALVVSLPARGIQPLYTTAAVLGVALFGLFAVLVLGLTRAEGRTAGTLCRVARRLPLIDAAKVEGGVHRVAARLRDLAAHPRLLVRAVGWAAANWLLDAASLWVFLAAFGHQTSIDALLVAYCLANVLGALPVTPGGLGIIEGVLTPTLIGFGVPGGTAVLGVVAWRLVNFWVPIPAGGVAYLSLRLGPGEKRGRRAKELEQVVEEARRRAQER